MFTLYLKLVKSEPTKNERTGSKRHLVQKDKFQEIAAYLKDRKVMKKQRDGRNNPDKVFGRMVASKLKSFREDKKILIKHLINQIIYNLHVSLFSTSESRFSVLEADLPYSQLQTTIIERENELPQPVLNYYFVGTMVIHYSKCQWSE